MKRSLWFILIITLMIFPFSSISSENTLDTPILTAQSSLLMEQNSGKILYENNAHQRMYPASTTKNLLALLVLENLSLTDIVTSGDEINLVAWDASRFGLKKGDQHTVEELLWALMLRSGNDAAYTLAVFTAKKVTNNPQMNTRDAVAHFVAMMNERAQGLGAVESNFVNPDGYHLDEHYSTAYDLTLIAREAMKNDFFKKLATTASYTPKGNDENQKTTRWINRNLLVHPENKYYYPYATGIKTGHTSKAGFCLSYAGEKEGLALLGMILNCPTEEDRWTNAITLMTYGFDHFTRHSFVHESQIMSQIKVVKHFLDQGEQVEMVVDKSYADILLKKDIPNIQQKITWVDTLLFDNGKNENDLRIKGPIKKDQTLGFLHFILNGNTLFECELKAAKASKSFSLLDRVALLLQNAYRNPVIPGIIIILLLVLLMGITILRRKSRKHKHYSF